MDSIDEAVQKIIEQNREEKASGVFEVAGGIKEIRSALKKVLEEVHENRTRPSFLTTPIDIRRVNDLTSTLVSLQILIQLERIAGALEDIRDR